MARVTSFRDDAMPSINTGVRHVRKTLSLVNGSANDTDTIDVMVVAPGQRGRLVKAEMRVSASLGAGATVQLRADGTAITPASTAAAASKVDSDSDIDMPMDLDGGEVIDLLVAGANITAGADVTVDLYFASRS